MATKTKSVTFPYAVKTIAIDNVPAQPYAYTPTSPLLTEGAEMALVAYPPLHVYQTVGLYTHIQYTFNGAVAIADQVLQGIYVRDTASSYIELLGGSTVENYMPLNVAATAGTIDISLDLSSLIIPTKYNVIFLHFPPNVAGGTTRDPTAEDTVVIWKIDLVYQTIGVRNEK